MTTRQIDVDIYTAKPYNIDVEFIETTRFSKLVSEYLSDDEYAGFQYYLLQNPESGKIIRSSGGIRKVRWKTTGKGKSGGGRIIYYYKKSATEIWLLTIYRKSEMETIPIQILRRIAKELENDKT